MATKKAVQRKAALKTKGRIAKSARTFAKAAKSNK